MKSPSIFPCSREGVVKTVLKLGLLYFLAFAAYVVVLAFVVGYIYNLLKGL